MLVIQARHQTSSIASGSKRSCGFAPHDGKIVFGRGSKVEDVVELMVFRNRNVGTAAGNHRHDLLGVAATEGKPVNEEPITGNHGLRLTGLRMNGRDTTSLLGFIVDVIVDQCGGVYQFERQSEGHDIIDVGTACKLIREEKQNGTQPLPTCIQYAACLNGDFACTQFNLGLNEVLEGLIDLIAYGFQRRTQRLNITAHTSATRVGFLTGRPRP